MINFQAKPPPSTRDGNPANTKNRARCGQDSRIRYASNEQTIVRLVRLVEIVGRSALSQFEGLVMFAEELGNVVADKI
jgi:hypothetical protein